jgi:hypothetical protein
LPPSFKSCAPFTYIFLGTTPGSAPESVLSIESWLVDVPLITRAHEATFDRIMQVRSGQQQKKIDDTNQRPIPKL